MELIAFTYLTPITKKVWLKVTLEVNFYGLDHVGLCFSDAFCSCNKNFMISCGQKLRHFHFCMFSDTADTDETDDTEKTDDTEDIVATAETADTADTNMTLKNCLY